MTKLTRGQTRDKMRRLERDNKRLNKTVEDQAQIIRKLKATIVAHEKCVPIAEDQESLQED